MAVDIPVSERSYLWLCVVIQNQMKKNDHLSLPMWPYKQERNSKNKPITKGFEMLLTL